MGDIRESTETFMREKVEPCIKKHVGEQIADHMDKTETMHIQTLAHIADMHELQNIMNTTMFGKRPPDPENPGAWNYIMSLVGWKKNVNRVLWIGATVVIGLLCTAVWNLLITTAPQ